MTSSPLLAALAGVCPVLAVPFGDDESLDVDGFLAGVADVAAAGARAVMWPGFASEFHKLTGSESDLLQHELLGAATDSGLRVVIAVQDHATRPAIERAVAAMAAGAAGINLLPPFFLDPTATAVAAHVGAVCEEVGDGEVVLQYAPGFTGSTLTPAGIADLATGHPNLRAVKIETGSPGPIIRVLSAVGLASTVGLAGLHLVEAQAAGAIGVQPGAGFVRLYVDCWRQLQHGNPVAGRNAHRELLPILLRWTDSVEHILAADKAVLHRRGVIGSRTVRRPGRVLDPEDETLVDRVVRLLG